MKTFLTLIIIALTFNLFSQEYNTILVGDTIVLNTSKKYIVKGMFIKKNKLKIQLQQEDVANVFTMYARKFFIKNDIKVSASLICEIKNYYDDDIYSSSFMIYDVEFDMIDAQNIKIDKNTICRNNVIYAFKPTIKHEPIKVKPNKVKVIIRSGKNVNTAADILYGVGFTVIIFGSASVNVPVMIVGGLCGAAGFICSRVAAHKNSDAIDKLILLHDD